MLHKLHSPEVFTTMDLKNGILHVENKQGCAKYLYFITRWSAGILLVSIRSRYILVLYLKNTFVFVYKCVRKLLKVNKVEIYLDQLIISFKKLIRKEKLNF